MLLLHRFLYVVDRRNYDDVFMTYLKIGTDEILQMENENESEIKITFSKRFIMLFIAEGILKYHNNENSRFMSKMISNVMDKMSEFPHLKFYIKKLQKIK